VLTTAIDRYLYVALSSRFEPTLRVAYSTTEIVRDVSDLKHTIMREALTALGFESSLEITTIGDLPAGAGMGSSSALAVGLLRALYAFRGESPDTEHLARLACSIEIDRMKAPIGRQDQYISAYGGFRFMTFEADGSVTVHPVGCSSDTVRRLEEHLLFFYTGETRSASDVLADQWRSADRNRASLRRMRDIAVEMRDCLVTPGGVDIASFGALLDEGWQLKRSLSPGISNSRIDSWYETGRLTGALGGKLLGAGGGGFLLLLAHPNRHDAIRRCLGRPREISVRLNSPGSRIVCAEEGHEARRVDCARSFASGGIPGR
jgi:D-glycero-alpha-D-manno-heptose-7-phosphate kinase